MFFIALLVFGYFWVESQVSLPFKIAAAAILAALFVVPAFQDGTEGANPALWIGIRTAYLIGIFFWGKLSNISI